MNKSPSVFSRNLVKYRKKAGLTQQELAEKLYICRATIANMESGVSYTTLSRLIQVCDLLKITPNDLLLEENDK